MISVIIPTYNEAGDIKACLESLSKQALKDFEVIVVDDGSTDNTNDILTNFRISKFGFRVLHAKHGGAGAARNLGVKHAKGVIYVFVDADMTFDKNFLKNLIKPILAEKSKGTFSKDEFVSNWENIWARCWNLNEGWQPKRRHPKNYPDTQPVFRAILAKEFNRVGGFTPGGYDDDWSLSKKLGYEALSSPNAIFYHKNPSTLSEVFGQAKWVGKRRYKLGLIGTFFALIRSSLPVSIFIGLYKGWVMGSRYNASAPKFLLFKIVYDFGVFMGILEFLIRNNPSK